MPAQLLLLPVLYEAADLDVGNSTESPRQQAFQAGARLGIGLVSEGDDADAFEYNAARGRHEQAPGVRQKGRGKRRIARQSPQSQLREAGEYPARDDDVQRRGKRNQMDPARGLSSAGGARPSQRADGIRCGQSDARQNGRRPVKQHCQSVHGGRAEERALPTRFVPEHQAADVQTEDQTDPNECRGEMHEPLCAFQQQRMHDSRPFGGEASQSRRQRRIEARGLMEQGIDATADPTLIQVAGPEGPRPGAEAAGTAQAHARHHQRRVDEQVPSDEPDQRETENVDPVAAIESRQTQPDQQRDRQHRSTEPGHTTRDGEYMVHRGRTSSHARQEPFGAAGQKVLCGPRQHRTCLLDRPASRLPHRGAGRLGPVRERKYIATAIGFLDRLNQENRAQRRDVHTLRINPFSGP